MDIIRLDTISNYMMLSIVCAHRDKCMRALSLSVCIHAHYTTHMHTRYIALCVYAHTRTVAVYLYTRFPTHDRDDTCTRCLAHAHTKHTYTIHTTNT